MKHYEKSNPKPELVIGLAGPVGTDLRSVSKKIASSLRAYQYETGIVRVSDALLGKTTDSVRGYINDLQEDRRIDALMNAGDFLRCEIGDGAAIIPDVLTEIRRLRQNFLIREKCFTEHENIELYNRCFLINSLKHPDEVKLLRKIYGDKFILISVVAPLESRKKNLIAKISESYSSTENEKFDVKADRLIEKDRQRLDTIFGQSIGETFPLGDFFLRAESFLNADVDRFLRILFGDQKATPTRLEFAMFEARSNALRSADLSRQVGAVVTGSNFEIIARGCNEVPVAGGDTYWSDDDGLINDNRDISEGRDFNSIKKVEILKELIVFLEENKVVSLGNKSIELSVDELVFGDLRSDFKHLRVSNLIEFGRMIHAEMAALMESARRGLPVKGGKMIVTTFPCHMCARHIISAGIDEVYFIEPYPKSMTAEMYKDEIQVEPSWTSHVASDRKSKKVLFKSFHGVAPRFFNRAFEMTERKDRRGYTLEFDEVMALPPMVPLSRSHLSVELVVARTSQFVPEISSISKVESTL